MSEKYRKITIASVAALAGVSNSAVSKVLLGGGGATTKVSQATAERIRLAASKLNYQPNLLARQLVAPRNNLVGAICDSTQMISYSRQLPVIQDAMFKHQFLLQLGIVHDDFASIKRYVDYFRGLNIRNIICFAHSYPGFSRDVPELFNRFQNVVFIDRPDTSESVSYAESDVFEEVHGAIMHLAELGRRRTVFYLPRYRDPANAERSRALGEAYCDAGLAYEGGFCWEGAPPEFNNSPETIEAFFRHVVEMKADAVICPNDYFALKMLDMFQPRNMDIRVFSSDRQGAGQPFLPDFDGNLIDYEGIAREAAKMLIENSMTDTQTCRTVKLPVRIYKSKT